MGASGIQPHHQIKAQEAQEASASLKMFLELANGDLNTQTLGIAPLMAQANLLLSDVRFSDYISDVTTRQMQLVWNPHWGGSDGLFRVLVIQQQQAIRDEAQNGSVRSTAEASVNTSIISFLQAIADLAPQSGRQWTADRSKLTADFSTRRRKRQFVAYTDGQLEDTFSRRILALVVCQRSRREKHSPAVDMQEPGGRTDGGMGEAAPRRTRKRYSPCVAGRD
ncbi:hypothetical protein CNMCM5793_002173 [Aspergillus hiratsukae]|uniref:Uncharacterized protein n=1 Tax=Aspergillus hiratsukae TaxID=1194566 RepID=A0A8H6Q932_9EURO|nr:hypothetical protein CNMCM5793_002173 [Aspergillus hiratsukae]KAF7168288.1 hypothetical protein CNMCM6106_003529 [Aspergillus hiratsukae]